VEITDQEKKQHYRVVKDLATKRKKYYPVYKGNGGIYKISASYFFKATEAQNIAAKLEAK